MIVISYVIILCLAASCQADCLSVSDQRKTNGRIIGEGDLLQTEPAKAAHNRLIRRGTDHRSPSSTNNQQASHGKSSQQSGLPLSRSARNFQEHLQKSGSSSNVLSFSAPKTADKNARRDGANPRIEAIKLDRQKSTSSSDLEATNVRTGQGSASSGIPRSSKSAQKLSKETGTAANAPSKATQRHVSKQSTAPSESKPKPSDSTIRIAHDSGATLSTSSANQKRIQDVSARTSTLSLDGKPQMMDHNEWFTGAKESVRKAEQNWKRTSKSDRRYATSYSAVTDTATAKATQSRTNAKNARTAAKETIAKADELLHSKPASSPKAQECVMNTYRGIRTACAIGAVHAQSEQNAAKVAKDARRWDLAATHIKASAVAMTRARALEEQGYTFLAQHRSKAAEEKAQALPKDHPNRQKAEKEAEFERKDYERTALFYHDVHDQYHQTHKAFSGSESEDEERIFPDISY